MTLNSEPRIHVSLVRDPKGQAVVQISDPTLGLSISLPEEVLPRLDRLLTRPFVALLRTLAEHLTPTSHGVSFWAERPPGTERLMQDEFLQRLMGQAPARSKRYLRVDEAFEDWMSMTSLTESDIRACVDLGLHQWREIPHQDKIRCAICGGGAATVLPTNHEFETLLSQLERADLGVPGRAGDYERWARPWEMGDTFRLLIDAQAMQDADSGEREALEYLSTHASPQCAVLRLPEEGLSPWLAAIPAFEVSTSLDVDKVEHQMAELPAGYLGGRTVEVGTPDELRELGETLGGGESGLRRAQIARVGAEFAHLTVTSDREFLRGARHRHVRNVVSPRAALIGFGLHARKQNSVPMRSFRIVRDYFYDDRTLALVPEIAGYLNAAHEAHGEAFRGHVEARLCLSAANRLAMMARAEDEIAFRAFFPQKITDHETLYHFEYLLLLARALIEGLGQLAATVHKVENPRRPGQLSWKLLLNKLRDDRSKLLGFLKSKRSEALSELVARLRNPLAHADRWQEIHSGGPAGPSAKLVIAGPDAADLAASIRALDGDPARWGAEGHRLENGELELYLDPFPFTVHLNVFLMTYTGRFLAHLAEGAGRSTIPLPAPWEYVNPPMDRDVFDIVGLMSWPLLPPTFFD